MYAVCCVAWFNLSRHTDSTCSCLSLQQRKVANEIVQLEEFENSVRMIHRLLIPWIGVWGKYLNNICIKGLWLYGSSIPSCHFNNQVPSGCLGLVLIIFSAVDAATGRQLALKWGSFAMTKAHHRFNWLGKPATPGDPFRFKPSLACTGLPDESRRRSWPCRLANLVLRRCSCYWYAISYKIYQNV